MKGRFPTALAILTTALAACGGGGSDTPQAVGSLTVVLTDAPMQAVNELVVHVEYLELHHVDGRVVRVAPTGGPVDIDLAALEDGRIHDLLDRSQVPAGHYHGLTIGLDPDRSHVGFWDGSHHPLQFADPRGLEVEAPFAVGAGAHAEYVVDVDLGRGLQWHDGGMGGGMGGTGGTYALHSAVRMLDMSRAGGLQGGVDGSLVDVNHPACDPDLGGNTAYLFPGDAAGPDDIAGTEADGRPGPIATDRVELHPGVGEYRYHFAFLEPGSYRVAVTCAGEWDEAGDDDYPADPDGRFDFQALSAPAEVVAGQVTVLDVAP